MADWPASVDELSTIENASIRAFVESCAEHFTGRILDFGCGQQPYRDVISRSTTYRGWDTPGLPGGSGGKVGDRRWLRQKWDAILCTQVIEYLPIYVAAPEEWDCDECDAWPLLALLETFREMLAPNGALILTGPSSWIEPPGHLHNFTIEGIRQLLTQIGFTVERLESRGHVGPGLSIGYGAVARA